MKVTLATTWHPRGEINRLILHLSLLRAIYAQIVIITPPLRNLTDREIAELDELNRLPDLLIGQPENWSGGRYTSLKAALETNSSHIQYADMDRLLRWMETRPDEWRQAVVKNNLHRLPDYWTDAVRLPNPSSSPRPDRSHQQPGRFPFFG